jgi:glycogen debranching enzyme
MRDAGGQQPDSASRVDPLPPARRLLYRDYCVLDASPDGSIDRDSQGLYDHDTRILSRRRLTVDGVDPSLLASIDLAADHRLAVLRHARSGGSARGPALPQDLVEIRVRTMVGSGMAEEIRLTNRSAVRWAGDLAVRFASDFADVQEAGRSRRQSGAIEATRVDRGIQLVYTVAHGDRRLERGVRLTGTPAPERIEDGLLSWRIALEPRGSSSVELRIESLVDGAWRSPPAAAQPLPDSVGAGEDARVSSEPPLLGAIVSRAMRDLVDLRNRDLPGDSEEAWVPNAGVPTYTGLFGRDSVTAGWQSGMAGAAISRGSLALLAGRQATEDDPFRDSEPGKLLHEMRRGPLSELDIIPQRAYYGSQTTPAMFVLALSELWHWTGDTGVLRRHRDTAERALRWAAERGDRDGDGFLESLPRSAEGLRNQAWKDSDEAIRHPDGRNVEPPLATVEEQAFHILALERMAEILVALGEDGEADRYLERAEATRRRWHDAYWLDDLGFYALALDGEKRPVATIASNAGHALGAGIVPRAIAPVVADRLLADDLFSGWGVRTLSDRHPSYNPFAYHLGTVWPVEQATFALGFKRYGLDAHVGRLADAVLAAAAGFRDLRLPEVVSGLPRSDTILPVPYPDANCPQAWTASATVQLLQVLLGIYPFAPLGALGLVRPRLPGSVRSVTVRDLRVGDATVTLRFERGSDGTTEHEVVDRRGRLLVIEAPPPQDVGGRDPVDAIKAWAIEHAPGRDARAFRIALGLERKE